MFLTSKRFWKRLGIGFAVVLTLLLVAYGIVSMWANNRLESRLAKLRAAGEPTSIAELAPEPVPADEDGATYLAKIAPEIAAFGKDHGQFFKTPLGKSYDQRNDRGRILSAEEIAAIRSILEKYPTIEPALRQATQCHYYNSRLDYSLGFQSFLEALLDKAQDLRTCVRMLGWKSEVLLAEGKVEEAVQRGLLVFRLSRLQEQEPAVVNGLVAVALRSIGTNMIDHALRSGPIGEELRSQLDLELASYDELDWFVRTLKSERPVNLSAQDDLFPHFPVTWLGTLLQADMLDFYEKLLPLSGKPAYLSADKIVALQKDSYSTSISGTLIGLLFPAMEAAHVAANRSLVDVRCLRVLNALQTHRDLNGHEAQSLSDLDLPEPATIDPFSGEPLKLKMTDDGWVVYSVMKNGLDDGGNFKKQLDWGVAPIGYPDAE